jgi:chitin disaccharide deacetylase
VHHVILHPCVDAAELRALADDWATRVSDYELLASGWLRDEATRLGIRVIGYRELAALIPPDLSPVLATQ